MSVNLDLILSAVVNNLFKGNNCKMLHLRSLELIPLCNVFLKRILQNVFLNKVFFGLYFFQCYDDMEREKGVKSGDKKQVFKYSAESDEATHRMDDLKLRVLQQKDKVWGVHWIHMTELALILSMLFILLISEFTVIYNDLPRCPRGVVNISCNPLATFLKTFETIFDVPIINLYQTCPKSLVPCRIKMCCTTVVS